MQRSKAFGTPVAAFFTQQNLIHFLLYTDIFYIIVFCLGRTVCSFALPLEYSWMRLFLVLVILSLSLGRVSSNALVNNLKAWSRWFSAAGGRWGHGVEPEVAGGVCYRSKSDVQTLGSYRVVTRSRVPRETVRLRSRPPPPPLLQPAFSSPLSPSSLPPLASLPTCLE